MKVVGSKYWRIEEQIREEAAAKTSRQLKEAYVPGPFGNSADEEEAAPSTLALVCVSCGSEVALVTADDLAAMEALPDHACPKEAIA